MFTYDLPKELIAREPCQPRDAARLMVLDRAADRTTHRIFRDLPDLLQPGDLLVLNDTRVIPARLFGQRAGTGGRVELLLLSLYEGDPLQGEGTGGRSVVYRCLGQPARSLQPGARLTFDRGALHAEVIAWRDGERLVRFEGLGAERALSRLGEMPLPPYIDRPVRPEDADWYQTVYAREFGAVAAPTAGLHFTQELLDAVRQKGIGLRFLTLHVGWGTFKPVGERELASGRLHPERFQIPTETMEGIAQAKAAGKRVIAVGTTVVRALETWAAGGAGGGAGERPPRVLEQSSTLPLNREMGLRNCARFGGHLPGAATSVFSGTTDLFIRPGFEFKAADGMITNFHLPGTSLLMLVSAFAGEERIRAAYAEAVRQRYRFYSYGDAMLIV